MIISFLREGDSVTRLTRFPVIVTGLAVAVLAAGVHAQNDAVPADLKPLLAKPASEMRLIVTRYTADRQTLNANYAGPGGFNMPGARGGGRRGAAPNAEA